MAESDEVKELKKQLAESDAALRESNAARLKERRESEAARLQKDREHEADLLPHRNTTLDEYLRYCHEHLFKGLEVHPSVLLESSSKATTTVDGKYYPLKLRRWPDFITTQRQFYDIIHSALADDRLLPSSSFVEKLAERTRINAKSEEHIKRFGYLALEDPVGIIFTAFLLLHQSHPALHGLEISQLGFDCVIDGISETKPDKHGVPIAVGTSTRRTQSGPQKKAVQESQGPRLGVPDTWCVRWDAENKATPVFPVEYKAAHKIRVRDFELALQKDDLFERVLSGISSSKLSTGDDRADDRADERVAKALAQTFHYMVCSQVSFGYLSAGKSLVFLHIADDARTLYHHMITPNTNVRTETLDPFLTGVAQLAAFCLRSLGDSGKTDKWLEHMKRNLKAWPDLYREIREPTADLPSSSPTAAATADYIPSDPSSEQEQDDSQSPRSRRTRSSCRDKDLPDGRNDLDDSESDESHHSGDEWDASGIESSVTVRPNKRKKGSSDSGHSASTDGSSSFNLATRPYCTQACLLGLKRRGPLDQSCPNVALHAPLGGHQHPITVSDFVKLLDRRMSQPHNRYRYCKPVDGKYGAMGQLFKLSSSDYGYTFVAKGTYEAAVPNIEHEADIYSQLDSLQGDVIPVYLGSIDLEPPYPLVTAMIVHMLLLSWGGDELADEAHAEEQQMSMQRLLRKHGILHRDMRRRHLLWNKERRSVMLIDFDCAVILPPIKHQHISRLSAPGKRKRKVTDAATRRQRAAPSAG